MVSSGKVGVPATRMRKGLASSMWEVIGDLITETIATWLGPRWVARAAFVLIVLVLACVLLAALL